MLQIQNYVNVVKKAQDYFRYQLEHSEEVNQYLNTRISQKTVREFTIGYAPTKGLIDKLSEEDLPIALELGLIHKNPDNSLYESFSQRLMIPIFKAGIAIGFAGRTLIGHPTKYLNSKTSKLYNKSDNLYGFDKNAKHIYQEKFAILVEGYFDVLGLCDHEIYNVVATCGTALSKLQITLLRRVTNTVVICYDGDTAGLEATQKISRTLQDNLVEVKVIYLPTGDPDEFVKKNGKEKFLSMIQDLQENLK